MTIDRNTKTYRITITALVSVLLAAFLFIGWYWKEKQAMDELVSPGLTIMNYTDEEVYASVHYSKFPDPADGAGYGVGPHSGGNGLVCCVPIPTRWRPGIKMTVWYSLKSWQKEDGQTRIIELPEYPGGNAGDLFLSFLPDNSIELVSANSAPGHPQWPGKMQGFPEETKKNGERK